MSDQMMVLSTTQTTLLPLAGNFDLVALLLTPDQFSFLVAFDRNLWTVTYCKQALSDCVVKKIFCAFFFFLPPSRPILERLKGQPSHLWMQCWPWNSSLVSASVRKWILCNNMSISALEGVNCDCLINRHNISQNLWKETYFYEALLK